MLSAGPDVYSLPETHFFSEVMPRLCKPASDVLTEDDLLLALSILQDRMVLDLSTSESASLRQQASQGQMTGKDLFEFVLELYRPPSDIDKHLLVIEKTPRHALFLSSIRSLYPDAKFVHIVREPKNVISSWLNAPFAVSNWIPWYAERWNNTLDITRELAACAPDSLVTIRYEDLVEASAVTLQKVCEFLQLRYVPEMLTAYSSQLALNAALEQEPWKQPVDSSEIQMDRDVWKERISAGLAWYIEQQTRANMEACGYPMVVSASWQDRVTAYSHVWSVPRRNPKALEECVALSFRYAERGDMRRASGFALRALYGDWRLIRNGRIRRILTHRLQSTS
jgi:hypothetical protein